MLLVCVYLLTIGYNIGSADTKCLVRIPFGSVIQMFCVVLIFCWLELPFQWVQMVTYWSCGVHIGVHNLISLYSLNISPTATIVSPLGVWVGTIDALGRLMLFHWSHQYNDPSKFGLTLLQYFVGDHHEVQADRSLLIIKLCPCRPWMTHCLTIDVWGESHTVSWFQVPVLIQESFIHMFYPLLDPPMWSCWQHRGKQYGIFCPKWSYVGIYLYDLFTWYFSCHMTISVCCAFSHFCCCFLLFSFSPASKVPKLTHYGVVMWGTAGRPASLPVPL